MRIKLRASEKHADALAKIAHGGKLATYRGWAEYALANKFDRMPRADLRDVLAEFEAVSTRQQRNVLEKVLHVAPAVPAMCDHVATSTIRPGNINGPVSTWLTFMADRKMDVVAFDDEARSDIDKRLDAECAKEHERREKKRADEKAATAAREAQERQEKAEAASDANAKLDKALGVTDDDTSAATVTNGKTRVHDGTQAEPDPATVEDLGRAFATMTDRARSIVDELAEREPEKGKAYDLAEAREALRRIEKIAATVGAPKVVDRKAAAPTAKPKAATTVKTKNGVTLAAHV